jgi:hypothetical protein
MLANTWTRFLTDLRPVVRLPTFRLFLALAAAGNQEILQIDVKTAFLYGRLRQLQMQIWQDRR